MSTAVVRPHRPLPEASRPPRLELISEYPRYWAGRAPDREAVVFEGSRWGFGELADRVDACAQGLLAAGVGPGDRVATLSPPHPDFYVTFLAAASIGAIWLGLNPRYQIRELDYAVNDALPKLVFTRSRIGSRDYQAELGHLAAHCPSVERFIQLDGPIPLERSQSWAEFIAAGAGADLAARRATITARHPCVMVYTSGTTGRPKGAIIDHYALIHVARVQAAIWPIDPIRALNNLPINHIGCVGDVTVDTLVPGGTLVFQEQVDPAAMLAAVPRERITFFGHVPTALQLLVNHPTFESTDFSSVQVIIWEGAAAPVELIERLRARCPEVANAYGMTETVGSVTFTFDSNDIGVLADSVGWPAPDYQVRIAGPAGEPIETGAPGEIQVKGDFVTRGYWNRPEATRELFTQDGWLKTGDLARERPDDAYQLIGRLKEMFKSGGYNVYPREIEQVLEAHPDVAMAAVIGVADPLYQEVGHAFVMVHPGRSPAPGELERHCREALANYKVPKRFTVSVEFPMLPIGKIDKQALKATAG